MTQDHEIDISADDDEFWILAQARGALLGGMAGFLALVEVDAAACRAVISVDVICGIGAWRDLFITGRDVCLAIESRIAAEEAIN